ncbi:Dehydrogenase (flavoprotein) [Desulfatibacillum alkenivorans DSM 16219]|jgi:flavin-dependent dehydrogenase|uniref:Dehydrogenase (Flavoprotein) n=1 Tax=Desulfatibacillum alkenivorans DSM 16219 TaxID=1121393 RepID=A0A1M6FSM1_9BACT|nr:FAD-dependent monooxygenase [Desulfatibacillum alkenivorans]SHJ00650.1 Dehydrogenase (flavoprotein) [Desulfatibacillum alkenivorans DSM 16219]
MIYDFIFAGAGPAGLTGAILAARQGKRCLLIEKKSSLDLHPRGETLRHRPILDEVLGEGVMASLTIASTTMIEYFAPLPHEADPIILDMKVPNHSFEWHEWMQAFQKQVQGLSIDLKLGAEVIDVTKESGRVTGVKYLDADGSEASAAADAVFASDGHGSLIGRKLGVDYTGINYPIVKSKFGNARFDSPGFKFFFLPEGSMDFAPDFPPALAFLFPREGSSCEVGLAVMARAALKLGYELPDPEELLQVFEQATKRHPVMSNMLAEASADLVEATMLPMGGPMEEVIPQAGVVLLGDAAGFVEISGGSGLISSMESAKFWVNLMIGQQAKAGKQENLWSKSSIQAMTEAYTSSGIFRHNKAIADGSNVSWDYVFTNLRTSQNIIKKWGLIANALDIF